MFNSTKYSLILGLFCLAIGWVFFVQKTTSEIEFAKAESFKLKSDLIELRWGQIINKDMKFGELKSGPEVFNISLAGLDKSILDSEFERGYQDISPGLIKAAYLDSGLGAPFFTTKVDGFTFFVKVDEATEDVMLQGFPYSYILNLLGASLENDEWYFLDSKNRVVFSYRDSYLGKSKDFKAANSRDLKMKSKRYSIQMANTSPYSSSSILGLGLVGFLLLGFASFPNSSPLMKSGEVDLDANVVSNDVIVKKEPSVKEANTLFAENIDSEAGLDFTESEVSDVEVVGTDEHDIIGDEEVEGFQTLDLSSQALNEVEGEEVGYSEFLTENPSLSYEMPAIPNKRIIEDSNSVVAKAESEPELEKVVEAVQQSTDEKVDPDLIPTNEDAATQVQLEDTKRSGNDWIKLAEELSANLEKFAGEWTEEKPQPDKEA